MIPTTPREQGRRRIMPPRRCRARSRPARRAPMPTARFPGYTQNVIACVWDFDKTLIPGYMQEPIFRRFKVDERAFWEEVNGLPAFHRRHGLELVAQDSTYLSHILTYVRHGLFPGLNNRMRSEERRV